MESESKPIHPARLPDPDRVKAWRKQIEVVHWDVVQLLWWREVDNRWSAFVVGNDYMLHAQSDFPKITKNWYQHSACMAIRRLVDQGSEGPVYSLRLLLQDMKRACQAFNRDSIDELLDEPSAPKYDPEFREFLVSRLWQQFKDPKDGTDRLLADMIKADLLKLEQASARIKRYADLSVAHHSTAELTKPELPTNGELNACIDVIHDITKRWITPLTGMGYSSLEPVYQSNWYDIFPPPPKREKSA
jgi:hypothetical protein